MLSPFTHLSPFLLLNFQVPEKFNSSLYLGRYTPGKGKKVCFASQEGCKPHPWMSWAWARSLTFLSLSFLTCKTEPLRRGNEMPTFHTSQGPGTRRHPVSEIPFPRSFRWINPLANYVKTKLLSSWVFKYLSVINVSPCCLIS